MDKGWELKGKLLNTENQNVINDFLFSLEKDEKSDSTKIKYRTYLQLFFKEIEVHFSKITSADIKVWMKKYENKWKEDTLQEFLGNIRSFYRFCVEKGHMLESPFREVKYWQLKTPLSNRENEKVINEFLLSLKVAGKGKNKISSMRTLLHSFFEHRETKYKAITSEEVKEWFKEKESWNKKKVYNNLYYLRAFYNYCVDQKYMEKSPIPKRVLGKSEKYWVLKESLPNTKNQEVLNEFLLDLKVNNYSYDTIVGYRNILQTFFKEREESFSELNSKNFLEWLNEITKTCKEGTVTYRLRVLQSFYNFCINEGYMEESPIKSRWFPRLPKPVPKYLEKVEVVKVQHQMEKESIRNRALVEFLLTSGCRIGEVYRLDQQNVDLENRTALVLGKGNKIRQVHFSEKCALLLERYLALRTDKDSALFVTSLGKPNRLSKKWMQNHLRKIGKQAELSGSLHPHRFRHTFATELLAKGAELSFIGDELGHSNLLTTQIYARLLKADIIAKYRMYMG